MRPTLTVASSLRPNDPWWRDVSLPSRMAAAELGRVMRLIAKAAGENEPVTGVAVVIRVPSSTRVEEQRPGWADPMLAWPLHSNPADVVVFEKSLINPHATPARPRR